MGHEMVRSSKFVDGWTAPMAGSLQLLGVGLRHAGAGHPSMGIPADLPGILPVHLYLLKAKRRASIRLSRAPGESPFGVEPEPGPSSSHPGTASPSLIEVLQTGLDDGAWDSFSKGFAIRRAGRAGFTRNVCVGLGNWGSPDAVPVLTVALADSEPLVRAHAAWALGRVGSVEAREALSSKLSVESDESVKSELAAAVAP